MTLHQPGIYADPAKPWITYYPELLQGSDEWLAARCGLVTASEVKLLLTPTLKTAANEKTRAHLYELAAQRISRYVEPSFITDDMVRGHQDEVWAAQEYEAAYAAEYGPLSEMGFVTNSLHGFTLGYSPDRMVGERGLLECKSRRQKFQVQTAVEFAGAGTIPPDFALQCHAGLLATERDWMDLVSYCGGMPMLTMRVHPDDAIRDAIIEAGQEAEAKIETIIASYHDTLATVRNVPTERRAIQEMF